MRTLIIAFVLLTFLNCETPAPQPNFLFIVADDLGHKDLSATGSEFYETPNIDRIAHEGTLFTQGYANASVCSPSRASLLTGLYPTVHGITDWIGAKYGTDWRKVGRKTQLLPSEYVKHLPFELTTLPEVFKTHQYKTFFAGKWHLGSVEQKSLPIDHGFEINKGGYHRGGPYSGGYFSPFNNPFLEDKPKEKGMTLSMKLARETTQEKWLKYQKKAVDQGILEEGFSMEKRLPIRIKQDNPVYAGLLEQTDEAVGHVLNTLDELKLDENTVVVFVSDNGGVSAGDDFATSNLPLRGGKGYQWEAGTRIPFFIKAPQIINPEKKVNTPVTGADLFPTLLELASIKNTTPVDGKSLVPLMEKKSLGERSLFWHYPHYGNQGGDPSAIIRKGYWKLIHYFEDGKNELYHLGEDMGESTNVFDQNTELGIALKNELEQWLETTGAKIPEKDPLHNDEEEEKWLSQHKQKMKLKVEKRRAFQLDPNYLPNEDWWGSTVD
jgi:arylsulfatase A-like enzyme